MRRLIPVFFAGALLGSQPAAGQGLRIALIKQPFSPTGQSAGPNTMAEGGIQQILTGLGAAVRVETIGLTAEENTEYGGWKRLGFALGHTADAVAKNEREGWFTVGLLATCPSMPGMVAGLQHSGPGGKPLRIGLLWLDAHPDFNTPETTRSGSLGGMPVAVATGRALTMMRLDAKLNPPLADRQVVMAGVRLTDPLEQRLLDGSRIEQLSVDDLRGATPAVFAQLDRLSRVSDKIYVHIDMDVLDPREVEGHGNKVPNGPSSEQLAALFEQIFQRYSKASAIGFASIPSQDEGGLSLAAVHRMIAGAVRGLQSRGRVSPARGQDARDQFFGNLKSLCGARFEGARTFPADTADSFAGQLLVAEFASCTDAEVRIPFAVGEDRSRTWIISRAGGGLQLKHDHRHPDGTPDSVTMYGGRAGGTGTALAQSFAADAHTATLIPAAATNVWTVSLSADHRTLTYHLARSTGPRFTAVLRRVRP